MSRRVVHLTSVHRRDDVRIFHKQCRSLAEAGYETFLVVADGLGPETRDGVEILDVGRASGRLARMALTARRVVARARGLEGAVYHLHDPELLPFGLGLESKRSRIVFDAHEDLPRQILSKPYLPGPIRRPVAWLSGLAERALCRRYDAVVAATPAIAAKFSRLGIAAQTIANYPIVGTAPNATAGGRETAVCYVGGLSIARGLREIVQAIDLCPPSVALILAGPFDAPRTREAVRGESGWSRVEEMGHLSREGVQSVLARSRAGLVTLHPTPAYLDALPVKLFEYMEAGLPVIASDFPLWREIVAGSDCGLCVDPLRPQEIAEAVMTLLEDPAMAARMGENGRRAVLARYNWQREAEHLLALYERLAGPPGT